ncbi:MAG: hypothetical protein AAGU11_16960 [Syntrophobacteraceae bacterium]
MAERFNGYIRNQVVGVRNTLRLDRIVYSAKVGEWRRLPYPGHPKGCPNQGRPPFCPPNSTALVDYLDTARPVYLVFEYFWLKNHADGMREKHPGWTDRQCRNLLYWQGIVRAGLKRNVAAAMSILGCDVVTYCPEGQGVNVFATARLAGLALDKTRRICIDHHIALIGSRAKL